MTPRIWPVHLQLLDDELLSSWITRNAIANACKIYTFTKLTIPNKEVWARDIDKSADQEVIKNISYKTGVPRSRVEQSTLLSYKNVISRNINVNGMSQGILPVGVRHRTRHLYGLQYCPNCLSETEQPYFTKKWRLIYSVCCVNHECLLLDRCEKCGFPVSYHRLDYKDKVMFYDGPISVCGYCGSDLSEGSVKKAAQQLVYYQKIINTVLQKRHMCLNADTNVSSDEYFPVLRNLMHVTTMSKYCVDFRIMMRKKLGLNHLRIIDSNQAGIEFLDVEQRVEAMLMAMYLLSNWPVNFIMNCRQYKPGAWWLLHDFERIPGWMECVLDELRVYKRT